MRSSVAGKLFFTCWLVYGLHFATDFLREHYLALSIVERGSIRVDPYLGLLAGTDIFDTPGRGAHIGGNPGASFVAAAALAPFYPAIRAVNSAVVAKRSPEARPPDYLDPRSNRQKFFSVIWQRGRDVEFGLVAIVTAIFCMAPLSAAGVVVMWRVLLTSGAGRGEALLYALAFAFATPVFMRTGTLSHNLIEAHAALLSYAILVGAIRIRSERIRNLLAGVAAGFTVLVDFSGVLCLAFLGLFALVQSWSRNLRETAVRIFPFTAGALVPLAMLSLYLFQAFGHLLYPGQHYMERPTWLPQGYPASGFVGPTFDLLWRLLLDPAYGVFAWSPLLLLGLLAPFVIRKGSSLMPRFHHVWFLGLAGSLWLFFSSTYYTTLQWNAGLRYLMPAVPFLFLAAVEVLRKLPVRLTYFIVLASLVISWSLAMVRADVVTSLLTVFVSGPTLRALTVLSYLPDQYLPVSTSVVSPAALFVLLGAVLFGIWWRPSAKQEAQPCA